MPRRIPAILLLLLLAAVSACSAPARHDASAPSSPRGTPATSPGPDPKTAAALIRIAQVFNTDYGNNIDGPVWDRWDARSQAVISRADYIRLARRVLRRAAATRPR